LSINFIYTEVKVIVRTIHILEMYGTKTDAPIL